MCRQSDDVIEIVGHEDEGNVERSTEFVDLVLKVSPNGAVDCSERFVQEQNRWLTSQRAGKRHPLTFTARQRVRAAIQLSRQVHQRQELLGS
jgi:hypothetical protein